jgi:hypothetical protein
MGISGKVDGGTRGKFLMMPWYEQLLQRWPDFTITFLGVLLGAGFGFYIEREVAEWQPASQERCWRASFCLEQFGKGRWHNALPDKKGILCFCCRLQQFP